MRQIILDTETTGLEVAEGHRVIEIGCIELVNRKHTGNQYHQYICPEREIDAAAVEVHGITAEFLSTQPKFHTVAKEFLDFVAGAELVIHNAEFDVGFLDYELSLTRQRQKIATAATSDERQDSDDDSSDVSIPVGAMNDHCQVLDTLPLARRLHPGQRNSLDALCKRYGVPTTGRELHGALLDARLLSEVYLAMTGGQAALSLSADDESGSDAAATRLIDRAGLELTVIRCSTAELAAHEARMVRIDAASKEGAVWHRMTENS